MKNRVIKFRTWCLIKGHEKFIGPQEFIGDDQVLTKPDLNTIYRTDMQIRWHSNDREEFKHEYEEYHRKNYVLQQFTGLLDKNNKEIYEGDIIKQYFNNEQFEIGKVEYLAPMFSFVTLNNLQFNPLWAKNNTPKIEIIGNIFENPNLLK